jgi:hypothetical protein|tara:strand:- start:1177 stop:1371 length:195 start_codon:yes stop_codon:yes gene_type:complete
VERLIIAIKKKINQHKTDLGSNLLSKGVKENFDRVQGIAQGLDKSLEIINETVEKYKEGDLDDQ